MPKFATEYDEMFHRLMPFLEAGVKPPELREQVQHLLARFQYLEARLPEYQETITTVRKLCFARLPDEGIDPMLDTDQLVSLLIADADSQSARVLETSKATNVTLVKLSEHLNEANAWVERSAAANQKASRTLTRLKWILIALTAWCVLDVPFSMWMRSRAHEAGVKEGAAQCSR